MEQAMKKNITKNLVKNINFSKILINNSFEPILKVEFSISLEQLTDIANSGIESKDISELIGNAILEAIKNRS